MKKPIPLPRMTAQHFARIVAELAAESENVFITTHASKRMRQRRINRVQVIEVLVKGRVVEGPALDLYGNWKATMSRFLAGQEVEIACALDDRVIVITVY